ncbi:hypothetical protein B0H14DRAFT_3137111 [Mycena olivaceomarginata]|nr:hypothetical protein B0H14DRAFT_3137111 [Mycena olivaceomarginata]
MQQERFANCLGERVTNSRSEDILAKLPRIFIGEVQEEWGLGPNPVIVEPHPVPVAERMYVGDPLSLQMHTGVTSTENKEDRGEKRSQEAAVKEASEKHQIPESEQETIAVEIESGVSLIPQLELAESACPCFQVIGLGGITHTFRLRRTQKMLGVRRAVEEIFDYDDARLFWRSPVWKVLLDEDTPDTLHMSNRERVYYVAHIVVVHKVSSCDLSMDGRKYTFRIGKTCSPRFPSRTTVPAPRNKERISTSLNGEEIGRTRSAKHNLSRSAATSNVEKYPS